MRRLPVHASMREISELIYETCKAYMIQQGKLLLVLELFIGSVMVAYFWLLLHPRADRRLRLQPPRIVGSFTGGRVGIRSPPLPLT